MGTGKLKRTYLVTRTVIVAVILMMAVIPVVLYVGLSLDGIQNRIRKTAEEQLSALLDSDVKIGSVNIAPFNRLSLRNVTVQPEPGDTALAIRRLGAGVDLWDLLIRRHITVNYVELIGMKANVWCDSAGAPLNISPIIEALKPKDRNKPPTQFDLRINTVIIRSSQASYNVLSAPQSEKFDPRHVAVNNLRADISLPRIANNDFTVEVKRLGLDLDPGFTIENLTGNFHICDSEITAGKLTLRLPDSSLEFADIRLPLNGLNTIARALSERQINVALKPGSSVYLPDFGTFVPVLGRLPLYATFDRLEAEGNPSSFRASADIDLGGAATVSAQLSADSISGGNPRIDISSLKIAANGPRMADILNRHQESLAPGVSPWLQRAGAINLIGKASLHDRRLEADARLSTTPGAAKVKANVSRSVDGLLNGVVDAATDGSLQLGRLLGNPDFGVADGEASAAFRGKPDALTGNAIVSVNRFDYRENQFSGLEADIDFMPGSVAGTASLNNDIAAFDLEGEFTSTKEEKVLALEGFVDCRDFRVFAPKSKAIGLRTGISVDLAGPDFNTMTGHASFEDTRLTLPDNRQLDLARVNLTSTRQDNGLMRLELRSDYLDGFLLGTFDFKNLPKELKQTAAQSFPALLPGDGTGHPGVSDFIFDFKLQPTEQLASTFNLPVSAVYPATLRGNFNAPAMTGEVDCDIPYLRQGKKLIEKTSLRARFTDRGRGSALYVSTTAPTKNGPMTFDLACAGRDNTLRSDISWRIDRARAYEGKVAASTRFTRQPGSSSPDAHIDILPGSLTFNDSTWTIAPAYIDVAGKTIDVNGINVQHGRQYVRINGTVSDQPDRTLVLDLSQFSLDYLFESLGIDKVQLGGDATGTFYASDLLSPNPILETPGLKVKNISYNKTVVGDALVKSTWDTARKAITLKADIDRAGHRARVDGAIFPMNDSLDITFYANHTPVGFMGYYMEAFASDISGYASGRARIYGNFKYIDLEGDVYADSLRMKINFTNTYYTATDSVHFRPGLIDLSNITIRDSEGHSANLNGWVRHKFFKEPRFSFALTDAANFLCYNETAKENPVWYGKVYGNGAAYVTGEPGVVNINVDISTAPKSTFTFVLSDQEVAEQYSFLTFRDKDKIGAELTDTVELRHDNSMDLVNRLREMAASHSDPDNPSAYNITIQTRITPDAQIVLVMDPIGGDRIRAYGSGSLRLDYGSANNDLKMYGTYTLDRGHYNFTLQDIIIKDFTIKPGSQISFRGDPYAAQLDIKAAYSLNANLSDLDESFLTDKDLNRTNVPVNAIMNVTGDMRQPEIAFDLEFPTLNNDVYRKVRSIVSTDDMMNRQIIYLLALNRFYTPEYMASARRGNELVSMASSTISSQLSSVLGSISDNWTVAPSFRSDRGDFSDMEFDVALSSRLLNNRLLFNGNFGYRDKSMNANQFVGDFDLEYLLNRSGTLRLKAYNRYNDQNYYLRQAATTQGVGIAIRKDFDSLTSFLKPVMRWLKKDKKKPKEENDAQQEPAAVPETPESEDPETQPVPEAATPAQKREAKPVPHNPAPAK